MYGKVKICSGLRGGHKTDKPIIKIEIPTPNLDNEEFEINNIESRYQ